MLKLSSTGFNLSDSPHHGAGGGHLREQQEPAPLGETDLFEAVDDAGAGDDVRVGDVTPVRDVAVQVFGFVKAAKFETGFSFHRFKG
jgi:hypothetical protein